MKHGKQVILASPAELGILLREQRKNQGLTLKAVSEQTGLGIRFLSEVERGKEKAEIGKVMEFCSMMGIDLFARAR